MKFPFTKEAAEGFIKEAAKGFTKEVS